MDYTPPMLPTVPTNTPVSEDLVDRAAGLSLNGTHDPTNLEGNRPMRVVMVQTALGYKPPSGGYRGNNATLVELVKEGHEAMQFCWAFPSEIAEVKAEILAKGLTKVAKFDTGKVDMVNENMTLIRVTWWAFVNSHGILCTALDAEVMRITYPNSLQQTDAATWIETGVRPDRAKPYAKWIAQNIKKFDATHVLFNDAFASIVSYEMKKIEPQLARVEIAHTLEQLPSGPYSGGVSGGCQTPHELGLWQGLDGIVSVSKAVQKYAEKECGLISEMIPNQACSYKDKETGGWPRRRYNFDKKNVVMINPAYMKGSDIYRDMAQRNQARRAANANNADVQEPVYNFHAYISWGIRPQIEQDLVKHGVIMHDAVADMEPVYDEMSVLIVPSLWQEAWGLVATEAQIRGIPVIASNIAGLPEAKRYVPPFVTVNPIIGTNRDAEGNYHIPRQHGRPWIVELDKLLDDEDRYNAIADMSYYTTRQWLRDFDVRHMERYLLSVMK